jgi:hypothetical protein
MLCSARIVSELFEPFGPESLCDKGNVSCAAEQEPVPVGGPVVMWFCDPEAIKQNLPPMDGRAEARPVLAEPLLRLADGLSRVIGWVGPAFG